VTLIRVQQRLENRAIAASGERADDVEPLVHVLRVSAEAAGKDMHHDFLNDEWRGEVQPGSRVRVRDTDGEEEYTVVRRSDADPALGRISTESPVGRALLGGRRRDEVTVQTPGGVRVLTIVEVAAPWSCSLEDTLRGEVGPSR
jgi:transcription elongation factor GreA